MYVHLERSEGIIEGLGESYPDDLAQVVEIEIPGAWIQLTYDELRIADDGETIARFLNRDGEENAWWLLKPTPYVLRQIPQMAGIYRRHRDHPFSDLVIAEGDLHPVEDATIEQWKKETRAIAR